VTVELECVQRAKRVRELLHRGAVDVFDAPAFSADGVMVVVRRLAEHERRLAVGIGPFRNLSFCAQSFKRAINRRERDARAGAFEPLMDFRSRKKARLAL
jgi:hypothetical protein